MMRRRSVLVAPLLLGAGLNPQATAQATALPVWPEVAAHLPGAMLAGQQRLRVWGFEVYDAQLWITPGFRASQYRWQPLALSLGYLRTLRGPAIAERSLAEMRRQGPISAAQEATWLDAMRATFVDVAAQDRLTGLHQPGQPARFWLNGQRLGQVADGEFSSRFFGIWLDPASSQPELRRALLAQAAP